jgi:nucleotide-binding universal stress UspA family protein
MNLLFGFGGDDAAADSLSRTLDRVADTGDALTLAVYQAPDVQRPIEALEAQARDLLAASTVDADVRTITEDPGSRLVALAASGEYDRIVLGGGTRSPLGKIAFDDVTEYVVLNAETSLTLLR